MNTLVYTSRDGLSVQHPLHALSRRLGGPAPSRLVRGKRRYVSSFRLESADTMLIIFCYIDNLLTPYLH
jgi:hypothetical protein